MIAEFDDMVGSYMAAVQRYNGSSLFVFGRRVRPDCLRFHCCYHRAAFMRSLISALRKIESAR